MDIEFASCHIQVCHSFHLTHWHPTAYFSLSLLTLAGSNTWTDSQGGRDRSKVLQVIASSFFHRTSRQTDTQAVISVIALYVLMSLQVKWNSFGPRVFSNHKTHLSQVNCYRPIIFSWWHFTHPSEWQKWQQMCSTSSRVNVFPCKWSCKCHLQMCPKLLSISSKIEFHFQTFFTSVSPPSLIHSVSALSD